MCLGPVQPLRDVVKDSGSFGCSALLSVVQGLSYPQLREKPLVAPEVQVRQGERAGFLRLCLPAKNVPLASAPSYPLSKPCWLQLALVCEGSAFLVETLAGVGRMGNVIKDVSYPTELLGGLEKRT